ncbi:hypothetical protein ACSBR2_021228 [Camellia fascicularis]
MSHQQQSHAFSSQEVSNHLISFFDKYHILLITILVLIKYRFTFQRKRRRIRRRRRTNKILISLSAGKSTKLSA